MTGNIFLNTQNIKSNTVPRREITSSESAASPGETADDFYKVTQVSYDKDLLDKGITSSAPVTLAVVPFTKLKENDNAKSDILNIQRNLNTITIGNVNEIIDDLTGDGFTGSELAALNDNTQYGEFKVAVSKISAAYNAKAAYMTHLANIYLTETDDNFSYDYGEGTYPGKLNAVSITQSETKLGWLESELKLIKSGYNITQLMQILRNAFARRKFGKNFTSAVARTTPTAVMPANLEYYRRLYESFFGPVYSDVGRSPGVSATDFDNRLDTLIIADTKDITYTAMSIDPNEYYTRFIGQLSNFDQEVELTNTTPVGAFSNLLKYTDESYTVLPVDVSVGDQDSLKLYRSADEFFLGMPLTTDKSRLKTRSQKFANDSLSIENSFKEDIHKLLGIGAGGSSKKDLAGWSAFLTQMNAMMLDSFYTTNSWTSIIRFSILLKAIEDARARKTIFKIMMLRERVRNFKQYAVSDVQENSFLTEARSQLEDAVTELVTQFSPTDAQLENATDTDELSFDTFKSALGQATPGFGGQAFEWDSGLDASSIVADIVEGLINPDRHQWDNFYTAAIAAEQITALSSSRFRTAKGWTQGNSVLRSRVGITSGFLSLSRDDRAFLFLSKWLSIIVDFPFSILLEQGTSPSGTASSGAGDQGFRSTKIAIKFKAFYSPDSYSKLRKSLSLTYTDLQDADSFENFVRYSWPISQSVIQDGQDFYDGVNFVYRFIMQTSSLLTTAANLAFDYTPVFNENLSNNYTYNAVLNLNRQSRFAFAKNETYRNFSKDQHKLTDTLNGFLKYIQDDDEVSSIEDSFVVVCGLPYGILDRLGAFDQSKIAYLNLTLTLRTINSLTSDDVIITKRYPVQGLIEHQLLNYTPASNASHELVLASTALYELNKNRAFAPNTQFSAESKKNELQSVSLLNYLQIFYGFNFSPYIAVQKTLPVITAQNVINAREKVKESVYEYRLGELIESRYASTGTGALYMTRSDLITRSLGGNIFDKIIAIPVDANLLTGGRNGYLVDVIASITMDFETRAVTASTRTAASPGSILNIDPAAGNSINNIINNEFRINR